jgi:hypothetical protein
MLTCASPAKRAVSRQSAYEVTTPSTYPPREDKYNATIPTLKLLGKHYWWSPKGEHTQDAVSALVRARPRAKGATGDRFLA